MQLVVPRGGVLGLVPVRSRQCRQLGEVIKGIVEAGSVVEELWGVMLDPARVAVLLAPVGVQRDPGMAVCLQLPSRKPRIPLEW